MTKYDVGIFGWWYNMNYGANLTYFSLNRTIQKMGYSVGMVWKAVNPKKLPDTPATRFAGRYYSVGPAYSHAEMFRHNDNYNSFLLGSDQLWSPKQEKVSGKDFFFSFVDEGKGKIAYAQSIGRNVELPEDFTDRYKALVDRFDGVSVREDYAVDVVHKGFGIETRQVCDPIFLSERETWDELIDNADIDLPKEKYVVNMILDPDKDKMDFCESVRKELKLKQFINFTALTPKVPWDKSFGAAPVENKDGCIENLVKAYSKADFIITDSFHGTCLAIVFNKPFLSIANFKRGASRFESLFRWLKLEKRLVYNVKKPVDVKLTPLSYTSVNKKISATRDECLKWLKAHLKGTYSVPRALGQSKCTGCGACLSVCPKGALEMKPDKYGYFRAFLNNDKCVDCKKCLDVCPALTLPEKTNSKEPVLYAFQAKDKKILDAASSGGIFPLVARRFIKEGGVVAGVAWTEEFGCRHVFADSVSGLKKLGKSKYMQSYMGDTIKNIEKHLKSGKKVLFSGCPCHVAGVVKYFGADREGLYTIDLLCGYAPSQLFFKKYAADNFNDVLEEYTFREKCDGWNCRTIKAKLKGDREIIRSPKDKDGYQSVFHDHTMTSPHCENCAFQSIPRYGDMTIGDLWNIKKHMPDLDVKEGISAILVNNEKGEELLGSVPAKDCGLKEKVPLEWLGKNGYAVSGKNYRSEKSALFYESILKNTFADTLKILKENREHFEEEQHFDKKTMLHTDLKNPVLFFEPEIWDIWVDYSEGHPVMFHTCSDNTPRGHFAVLPLLRTLKKGKKYKITISCVIDTESPVFNFHITEKDNPHRHQVIIRHKVPEEERGSEVTFSAKFECKKDKLDAFSIGAGHLTGDKRNIILNSISITEV